MKRPDSQDHAAARVHGAHRRCVCGDRSESAPSDGWRPRWWRPVVWADLRLLWDYVLHQTQMITTLGERIMAQQDQVNALAQQVVSDVAAIRAEVDEIKASHPDVDLSALEAAVGSLHQTAVDIDPSPEAPVDTPPADGGDGSAPVDSGDGSAPADGS